MLLSGLTSLTSCRRAAATNRAEVFTVSPPHRRLSDAKHPFCLHDDLSRGCAILEEDALLCHGANPGCFGAYHLELDFNLSVIAHRFDRLTLLCLGSRLDLYSHTVQGSTCSSFDL